ncbi:protein of unknown function [Burkholderia multivorans]
MRLNRRDQTTKNPQRVTRCGFPDFFVKLQTEFWWAPRESNPAPTDYAYQLWLSPPLSGLWSGLSLVFTTCPYSLYTFSQRELRSGLPRCQGNRGFPEFEQFYRGAERTCSKATHSVQSILLRATGRHLLSPLL